MGLFSYVHGPFMIPMIEELNWSRLDYSMVRTIGMFVTAVCGIFIGVQIDRVGARPVMLVGGTILVLSLALLTLIESLFGWWLLISASLHIGV